MKNQECGIKNYKKNNSLIKIKKVENNPAHKVKTKTSNLAFLINIHSRNVYEL